MARDGSDDARAKSAPLRVGAARFFEAIAGRYERAYALPRVESEARMRRVLPRLAPRSRVLDLGVGTGRELTSLLDAGHDVTGLDASEAMLARCARRARPVPLVQGDFFRALPFPDGAFDAVLALHGTLAHPESDAELARFVGEAHRVLGPRGVVVCEVPSPGLLEGPSERRGDDGLAFERLGPGRFLHVDEVVGLALEGRVMDASAWRELFGHRFVVTCTPFSPVEQLVVATRAP